MKRIGFGFMIVMIAFVMNTSVQTNLDEHEYYLPLLLTPYSFAKTANSPFYLQRYVDNGGCNWMGIAGEVLDLNRKPVPVGSYRAHVWGSGVDERVTVGSAPSYSPSGWEQFLFDSPIVRDYNVQLELPNGTAVSRVYRVQSRSSCEENLIRFDFVGQR